MKPTVRNGSTSTSFLAFAFSLFAVSISCGQQYTANFIGGAFHPTDINNSGVVVGAMYNLGEVHAAKYEVGTGATDLGTLGGDRSWANGINDAGTIVGYSYAVRNSSVESAFIYSNGTMSQIPVANKAYNISNGINNSGVVVGNSAYLYAFKYENGTTNFLVGPASNLNTAKAINSSGSIVGTSGLNGARQYGYKFENGAFTNLGSIDGLWTQPEAINDAGIIVGNTEVSSISGISRAFVFENGILSDLSGHLDHAFGINNAGAIVGSFKGRAALYQNGITYDLPTLSGVSLTTAIGINDSGQIIAENNFGVGYLLTSIPEPSTYAVMMGGCSFLAILLFRRRQATALK